MDGVWRTILGSNSRPMVGGIVSIEYALKVTNNKGCFSNPRIARKPQFSKRSIMWWAVVICCLSNIDPHNWGGVLFFVAAAIKFCAADWRSRTAIAWRVHRPSRSSDSHFSETCSAVWTRLRRSGIGRSHQSPTPDRIEEIPSFSRLIPENRPDPNKTGCVFAYAFQCFQEIEKVSFYAQK